MHHIWCKHKPHTNRWSLTKSPVRTSLLPYKRDCKRWYRTVMHALTINAADRMESNNVNNRPVRNRVLVPIQRPQQRYDPQSETLPSVTRALGELTETLTYKVTNGMNAANRTLWWIVVAFVVLAFLFGMLLMHTIEREIVSPYQKQNGNGVQTVPEKTPSQ